MKLRGLIFAMAAAGLLAPTATQAQETKAAQPEKPLRASTTPATTPPAHAEKSRGEKAFEANCSRCHQAPEQISPRITGTVLMHMRVRASLSKADEKALLEFLAP